MAALQCEDVRIGGQALPGRLASVPQAAGVVVVADSGPGETPRRQGFVAGVLHGHRLAVLRLLVPGPARRATAADGDGEVDALCGRVGEALQWLQGQGPLERLPVGLLGAGAGTAAALRIAAERPGRVAAVVSCGGRPDLVAGHLARVQAPTLLIVGAQDAEWLHLNRSAMHQLRCRKRLEIVPAATRSFEEPGALDTVAHLTGAWFANQLQHRAR